MKYVYGRKKWLAAGIAALLISGTGAVSDVLAAPVYTSGITTKAKKDKATFGSAYKVENGVNKYNLEDGSKISIHGTYHAEGITPGKGTTSVVTVGDGTGTLSIDTSSSEAGNSQGAGILASDGSRLTINGNLQIKTYGGSCFADGIYMMRAGTGTGAKANITVNGNVYIGDPAAVGEPPDSSSRDAKWGVNAAEIHGGYGPDGHVPGWADEYTGARWQPTGVDVDMSDGSSIDLNGDIFVLPTGTVNAAFTTANSQLHGIVDNGGTVNMWLRNGATWTNEARNTRYGEDNEDTGSNGASRITHFYGGNTAAGAGIINQKSDKAITIDHYSGNTTVNFGTLTQNGNGVTISAAADNSAITMSGDRSGLGETEAMERLAGKLTYTAYTSGERNLDGTVKLNEGLTARSVARTGRIDFNGATGKGRLGELSESPLMMKMMAVPSALRTSAVSPAGGLIPTSLPGGVAYILGDRETMMMRGAKSAMTTSMLSWRSGMTDMNQRLGDLRLGASSGMWARTYGGKVKYDKDKTNLSDSFWGAQVGADHKLGSGWHIGGAFDYNDGNAKYDFGGKGDPKLYVGSIYGTKVFDDGQYVDIVGKIGRAENDYTVYNAEGRKLDGDYHATGYGLSVEYGKRFGTATGYVEPQIQLLFSRLGSADYDAASDFDGDKKMHVHQDSMSSFIGRLGIAAGRATEKGNLYAKASILHEFKGDTAATFSAEGEDTSRVEQDFGDTWAELTLGGVYRLNGSNLFYANVTRGFGGDYKVEWKVNAGLRFAF